METKELIKFIKKAMREFKKDMKVADKYDMDYDYAYAEGAYNAYEVMLAKVKGDN